MKKTLTDVLFAGFQKGLSKAGAHVVKEVAKGIGEIAEDLERHAVCECVPALITHPDGSVEEVHKKGCPAR